MARTTPYDFLTFGDLNIVISNIVGWEKMKDKDNPSFVIYTENRSHFVKDPDGERFNHLVDTFTLYCNTEAHIDPSKLPDLDFQTTLAASTDTVRPTAKSMAQAFSAYAASADTAKPYPLDGFDPKPETRGDLRAKVDRLNTRLERQAATIHDHRLEIATKGESIIALNKKLSDRDATIRDRDATIDRLRQENGKLEEQVEAWDAHDAERARTETLLQARIEGLMSERDTLNTRVAQARASATKLSDERDVVVRDLQHSRGLVVNLRGTVADMRERMKELEMALVSDPGRSEVTDLKVQLARYSTFEQQVNAERRRQISEEGFTAVRDDSYRSGELIRAAICFALFAFSGSHDGKGKALLPLDESGMVKNLWPWSWSFWKTPSRERALVKATALLVAEGDRQTRAKG